MPKKQEHSLRTWKPRSVLVAGVAVLALVVGLALPLPHADPGARITRAASQRIKNDMFRVEVEAILGPPGDYKASNTEFDNETPFRMREFIDFLELNQGFSRADRWESDTASIYVVYDSAGVVHGCCCIPQRPVDDADRSVLYNLRRWAKRKWKCWKY
jgi:hypothetical protein